jgi:hypothetical protein
MFDDNQPTEVGRLRNDFLTDEQGRRIYCPPSPPFGPARWVPSRKQEEAYKTLVFWVTLAGGFAATIGTVAMIFVWENSYTTFGAWMVLALAVRFLSVAYFVRRWPAIPDSQVSYRRYVVAIHEKRNLTSLCFAASVRAVACVGFTIAPVWIVSNYPINWSELSTLKVIVFGGTPLLLTLFAPYFALSTYRAVAVLQKRLRAAAG